MSPTFVSYQDEVEVLEDFTPYTGFNTINLSGYIVDPTAIGLVMRITGSVSSSNVGIVETGGPSTQLPKMPTSYYLTYAVSLVGGSTVDVRLQRIEDRVFITGEIHGPDAVLYDSGIIYNPVEAEYDMWITHAPTPQGTDVIGDIDAVILRMVGSYNKDYGLRSGVTPLDTTIQKLTWEGGATWEVVGVDSSGNYETYTTGKSGSSVEDVHFDEIGYIKKSSKVVTINPPVDEGLAIQSGSFGTLDLSGTVSASAIIAGGRWIHPSESPAGYVAYLRDTGSSDSVGLQIDKQGRQTQMVGLNSVQQAEYQMSSAGIEWHTMWYEEAVDPDVPSQGDGASFLGPAVNAFLSAGPAVDVGAGFWPAVGATVFAGPAVEAAQNISPAIRIDTYFGISVFAEPFMLASSSSEAFAGPSSDAVAILGAGSGAYAYIGPAADGSAKFRKTAEAASAIGVG